MGTNFHNQIESFSHPNSSLTETIPGPLWNSTGHPTQEFQWPHKVQYWILLGSILPIPLTSSFYENFLVSSNRLKINRVASAFFPSFHLGQLISLTEIILSPGRGNICTKPPSTPLGRKPPSTQGLLAFHNCPQMFDMWNSLLELFPTVIYMINHMNIIIKRKETFIYIIHSFNIGPQYLDWLET